MNKFPWRKMMAKSLVIIILLMLSSIAVAQQSPDSLLIDLVERTRQDPCLVEDFLDKSEGMAHVLPGEGIWITEDSVVVDSSHLFDESQHVLIFENNTNYNYIIMVVNEDEELAWHIVAYCKEGKKTILKSLNQRYVLAKRISLKDEEILYEEEQN
jgi:hypothetical protein